MALDRLLGEEEPDADLAIDETVGDQLQHLDLADRRLLLQLLEGAWNGITSATVASRRAATDSKRAECSRYRVRISLRCAASTALGYRPPSRPALGRNSPSTREARITRSATAAPPRAAPRAGSRPRRPGPGRPARPRGRRRARSPRLHPDLPAGKRSGSSESWASERASKTRSSSIAANPAGEVAGAGQVLWAVAIIRRRTSVRSQPSRAASVVDSVEPEPLEQDVRRGVVRERQHQQRAVGERHRPRARPPPTRALHGTSTRSAGSRPDRQNAEATNSLIVEAAGTTRSPPSSRPSEAAHVITGGSACAGGTGATRAPPLR